MSITIKGTVERRDIGVGTWAIVTEEGTTYQIMKGADKKLLQSGQKVEVTGKVREDIMTNAMIGPVLEVNSFNLIF